MTLNFSKEAWQESLPSPGPHQAILTDMKFISKHDITWLVVTWKLADGAIVEELLGVDAPKASPMLAKTANGKRRIMGLCEIHGVDPEFDTYDDIMAAFVGKPATVVVAHRHSGGMDEPVIRGVSAPLPPKQLPASQSKKRR